ncbi:MAG: hypothetical protein AB1486_31650 [Planctomycetota bacterium]
MVRYEDLEAAFRCACELDPQAREQFLPSLPQEDRQELESLLSFDRPDSRIPEDGPPWSLAALLDRFLSTRNRSHREHQFLEETLQDTDLP